MTTLLDEVVVAGSSRGGREHHVCPVTADCPLRSHSELTIVMTVDSSATSLMVILSCCRLVPNHITSVLDWFSHRQLAFIQSFAPCGARAPLFPPCPFTSSFPPFYFSLSFIGFTYFLLLSIPSLSTRIVPLRFQAGGRRRRPNLGLVCVFFVFYLCYLYSLVKMHCGVLFYLV